ncbi:myosin-9-like [Lactuca sativa]|uniref:myosin-9-like n=1 Tax=Lactuca sativa TaxID=4236 RepID=UPI0022AF374C|nr:myosin-9-like [Lactuca sativa]
MAPQSCRLSATRFGRVTSSFHGTLQGIELPSFVDGDLSSGVEAGYTKVEAKYPTFLFKQQLTTYVEKIYGTIRDNLKKEISLSLRMCIQAPRISRASLVKGSSHTVSNSAQQTLIAHWQGIMKSLGSFLNVLKTNNVSVIFVCFFFVFLCLFIFSISNLFVKCF